MATESKIDDGGPAFGYPNHGDSSTPDGLVSSQYWGGPGNISVRDYFAAKAMTGLLAGDSHPDIELSELMQTDQQVVQRAQFAYRIADAMLAARKDPK